MLGAIIVHNSHIIWRGSRDFSKFCLEGDDPLRLCVKMWNGESEEILEFLIILV